MQSQALKNRLQKNYKKHKSWIVKNEYECFRLYHKDIPEIPYIIDIYKNYAVIYEKGKKLAEEDLIKRDEHQQMIKNALIEVMNIPETNQVFKERKRQVGTQQYNPLDRRNDDFMEVKEGPFKFWVNLYRYLDTGLFLDHRPLRQYLLKEAKNKKVLNLFSYTGSLSVAAAMGGAEVTTMDLSNTYLDWARDNFSLNKIDIEAHKFYKTDVLEWLRGKDNQLFDIILLDPPSFSNSKGMEDVLDVQDDHIWMIKECMKRLTPEGILVFSNNKKKFELNRVVTGLFDVKEASNWTIPQDFHHTNIHRSFFIKNRN
ncbi:MAG: class I SAM-dependent methyltransferase [Bacteriovoracaceae bacterium]